MDNTKNILLFVLLGVVLYYTVFAKAENDSKPKPEPTPRPIPIGPIPVFPVPEPTPDIQYISTSYDNALDLAVKSNRNILFVFGADYCPWCKKLKSETIDTTEVQNLLKQKYIYCYIDTQKDKRTARKYNISSIPVSVITDKTGKEIKKQTGYQEKNQYISWLSN